jgi:lysozyme
MRTSTKGIELIKKHEGLKLRAYKCPAGVWTIGYGHTQNVKEGDVITTKQAEDLLKQDLVSRESFINSHLTNINQNQFDAIISLVYNIGEGAFLRSQLFKCIKANPIGVNIKTEWMKWVRGGGTFLPGLAKRRGEELNLYFTN